ncbi:uracil-DNA glycosylase [Candidatus Saccharibacteria bacterium]|nr:uracil-DNA glycosylase [Candidatus Saccharibacteria bacterium]MCB9834549.1 uracil-DNA glycosylase [Candidatus Nomurabacteria bacterium]
MSKYSKLQEIAEAIAADRLYPGALNPVPGSGNPDANLVIIGEAPGQQEDQIGEPFVGRSGKVLDKMLDSIGLSREQVFITNVVKYRPPENRDPRQEEIARSIQYLDRQLSVIDPILILLMGRHALNIFFPGVKISEAHSKLYKKDDRLYLPLFHPATTLYNPSNTEILSEGFAVVQQTLKKIKKFK